MFIVCQVESRRFTSSGLGRDRSRIRFQCRRSNRRASCEVGVCRNYNMRYNASRLLEIAVRAGVEVKE
jgi:hypothetical protein